MPCTKVASSLGIFPQRLVFVTAFCMEQIYHTNRKKSIPVEEKRRFFRITGHHNAGVNRGGERLRNYGHYVNKIVIVYYILCRNSEKECIF